MRQYDIVVAGGGIAGLTAGLFAGRAGMRALVLVPDGAGGAVLTSEHIEDFPGFPEGIPGFELGPMIQEQAMNEDVEFEAAEASGLARVDGGWVVATDGEDYGARAVILATGSSPRRLGVPGEEEFKGKGISHCANCDGPLFRDRTVGVVGGGDAGLLEALELAKCGVRAVVFEREAECTGLRTYRRRVEESELLSTRCRTVVEEVFGNGTVAGVRTRNLDSGDTAEAELAGLFVYVGREPNTGFLRDVLALDESGRIPTDAWMRTELAGVFAAGDIRTDAPGQAVTAAGDGAAAAIAATRQLTSG